MFIIYLVSMKKKLFHKCSLYKNTKIPLPVYQITVLLCILRDTTNIKKVTRAGNLIARNIF